MDEDMRRVVVKEHYRQGDVVRALRESDGLDLDEDTLCALTTHCVTAAASFAHVVRALTPSATIHRMVLNLLVAHVACDLWRFALKAVLNLDLVRAWLRQADQARGKAHMRRPRCLLHPCGLRSPMLLYEMMHQYCRSFCMPADLSTFTSTLIRCQLR